MSLGIAGAFVRGFIGSLLGLVSDRIVSAAYSWQLGGYTLLLLYRAWKK
jgi:hypothetical protein